MDAIIFKKGPLENKWTRDDGQSQTQVAEKAKNLEIQKLLDAGWYMNSWGLFHKVVSMSRRSTRGYGQKAHQDSGGS